MRRYGKDGSFNRSVNVRITGTNNKTVVTLSKKAEPTAVKMAIPINNGIGFPLTSFASHIATKENTPVFL